MLSSDQSCPRLLSLAALAAFHPPPLNFTAAKGEPIHPQTVRDALIENGTRDNLQSPGRPVAPWPADGRLPDRPQTGEGPECPDSRVLSGHLAGAELTKCRVR
ncbi:hypothetical protein PGTUg99_021866 [Puccinia graminis f. sp. tritici]|uniref:Uncharacterized protein n=1 Tax=Puccinia graminis f. sp. tritici TaxID=56615 RepID=A0A5B0LRU6_PUCGR|nr:hypothetical protein PGTUg99_021866 [Puccinia graminis f. sp. tritici]